MDEDQGKHILEFRNDTLSERADNHLLGTPRLCLYDIERLSVQRNPCNVLAKGSPTDAEGIVIPFLTFDSERMSSS